MRQVVHSSEYNEEEEDPYDDHYFDEDENIESYPQVNQVRRPEFFHDEPKHRKFSIKQRVPNKSENIRQKRIDSAYGVDEQLYSIRQSEEQGKGGLLPPITTSNSNIKGKMYLRPWEFQKLAHGSIF